MSADVLAETLAELGRGDEIAVAERLKRPSVLRRAPFVRSRPTAPHAGLLR
jgi:hypothetical protein